jgi:hypothetical protein
VVVFALIAVWVVALAGLAAWVSDLIQNAVRGSR